MLQEYPYSTLTYDRMTFIAAKVAKKKSHFLALDLEWVEGFFQTLGDLALALALRDLSPLAPLEPVEPLSLIVLALEGFNSLPSSKGTRAGTISASTNCLIFFSVSMHVAVKRKTTCLERGKLHW